MTAPYATAAEVLASGLTQFGTPGTLRDGIALHNRLHPVGSARHIGTIRRREGLRYCMADVQRESGRIESGKAKARARRRSAQVGGNTAAGLSQRRRDAENRSRGNPRTEGAEITEQAGRDGARA